MLKNVSHHIYRFLNCALAPELKITGMFFSTLLRFLLYSTSFTAASAQSQNIDLDDHPKKGSYLYYGQPAFEDNSFLIEEAFNQERGVLQHIFNFYWDNIKDKNLTYSFSQEIPLPNLKHQLSYTLNYSQTRTTAGKSVKGFGDTYISYRPMILGEKEWAMVIPRFTIIVPTGNAKDGLGEGAFGG